MLEFLLLNHPLDCPVCDKGGECDLQDLTFAYGQTTSRLLDPKIRKDKAVELGNFIVLDNERCILCRRCVRFDDEIATEGNLILEERGHLNTVTTMDGQEYNSYFSGNTIELCPVGALTSELYRFKARPWDLAKAEVGLHPLLGGLQRPPGVPARRAAAGSPTGRTTRSTTAGSATGAASTTSFVQTGSALPARWSSGTASLCP